MSCLYKIKEALPSYTSNEKIIAEYILEHKEDAINKSAQELGQITKTSAAAWIRFAKKLGFKGLPALKMDLAKSKDLDKNEDLMSIFIDENDSLNTFVNKIETLSIQHLKATFNLLNIDALNKAINLLDKANRIYLVGIGGSGIVCTDLMHKFTRLDKNVIYHEDEHILAARIAHIKSDDVILAVSYSGNTPMVNRLVSHGKNIGATIIAITQYNMRSPLSLLADIKLFTPVIEKQLRLGAVSSRNSALALTDLLYYGVCKKHFNDTKTALIKTLGFIETINE